MASRFWGERDRLEWPRPLFEDLYPLGRAIAKPIADAARRLVRR